MRDTRMDRVMDYLLAGLGVVTIGLAAVAVIMAADSMVFRRAAHDDVVRCEQQHLKPVRKPLSAEVACVPWPERQDTLTIGR